MSLITGNVPSTILTCCFISSIIGYVYIYVNGEPFNRYRSHHLFDQSFPANRKSALVLGQESSQYKSVSVRRRAKSFLGSISHFMFYERPITAAEAKAAYEKNPSYKGAMVSWDQWQGKANKDGGRVTEIRYKNKYPFYIWIFCYSKFCFFLST